jgi:hypothetical protein
MKIKNSGGAADFFCDFYQISILLTDFELPRGSTVEGFSFSASFLPFFRS